MSDDIVWADPPSSGWDGAHRAMLKQFVEQLRERPGDWALYPSKTTFESARPLASRINRGTAHFPKGEFEATSRKGKVYVRCVRSGDE